jgi:hypothetical protein
MYEIEKEGKNAIVKLEKYYEECNMLKSKIILLETKEIMDSSVAEDADLKEF